MRLPLPRQPLVQHGAGQVLDALHQLDRAGRGRSARTGAKPTPQLPHHDRGDAVADDGCSRVVPRGLAVVVRVDVDEAGGDERAVGVDLARGRCRRPARPRRSRRRRCATSAVRGAPPVPSTTVPPRITRSWGMLPLYHGCRRGRAGGRIRRHDPCGSRSGAARSPRPQVSLRRPRRRRRTRLRTGSDRRERR